MNALDVPDPQRDGRCGGEGAARGHAGAFLRFGDVIEQVGLDALPRDAVRHLEGKLWELRMIGRDGIARAIYVTAAERRVVVVRVFVKKTQKTPPRELEIARQRAKEIT